MKRFLLILAALSVSLISLFGNPTGSLQERLGAHIEYLASHDLAGRLAGSEGGKRAAEYVADAFAAVGVVPFRAEGYFHPFNDGSLRNVVGCIEGKSSDTYIIIGAHYDHLGVSRRGKVFRGADDNASGVAALIEVARLVAESGYKPRHTLVFIAFDAEEKGLWGSSAFAAGVPQGSLRAMINMDMVGRLHDGALAVEGTGTLAGSCEVVTELAERHNLPVEPKEFERMPLTATDTYGFALRGAPTLALTTGLHKEYHQPSDTPEKIDLRGLELITHFAADLLRETDSNENLRTTGKVAKKHRTGINSLEIGVSGAFGNTRHFYPESGTQGAQRGTWSVGVSALYSLRYVAFRTGAHLSCEALTIPVDVMIKTVGRNCGFASVGGYWGYNLFGSDSAATPSRHEVGVAWSLGGKIGSLSIEATNRYALTPHRGSPHALNRTTLCTIGWYF